VPNDDETHEAPKGTLLIEQQTHQRSSSTGPLPTLSKKISGQTFAFGWKVSSVAKAKLLIEPNVFQSQM
jgi:hypothetical protein